MIVIRERKREEEEKHITKRDKNLYNEISFHN